MTSAISLQCPWCFEEVEILLDPETQGAMVEDCSVCCRPWQVYVERDEDGNASVSVQRAQ